ncbi:MAG: type IV toxin-antitoxin system AbiEi family antitoxin domain-containing protein [Elusimicrobiota bacterium]
MKKYLEQLQSKGIYTFTREDLQKNLSVSRAGINMNISRYVRRGRIARVKSGFYVIVPPEYRSSGILPPFWFIDDFMGYMGTDYYVGLVSAAAVYGASHQQPQVFQVVSRRPIKDVQVENLKINFVAKNKMEPEKYIQSKKTETGEVKISSPELTCFDLVRYISQAGGINNVVTILLELHSEVDSKKLLELADYYDKAIYVQRLGYLFGKAGFEKSANILNRWFRKKEAYPVYLVPDKKRKSLRMDKKWKVLVNRDVEPDLI